MFLRIKTKMHDLGPNFSYYWLFFLFIFLIFINCSYYLNADEGIILAGAWNLLNGQRIYIDWFSFIPPGSFYFVFIVWKIFFPSYLVAKFFSLLTIFAAAIGVYKISQLISKNRQSTYNLLAPSFFIISTLGWPVINHNCYNLALIIWSTYLFLKYFTGKAKHWNLFFSGVLLGLAAIFLLHKSLLIFLFFNVWLLVDFLLNRGKEEQKNIFVFNAAFIFFASTIFLIATPQVIYENLIKYPLLNYSEVNGVPFYFFIVNSILVLASFWYILPAMRKNKYLKFIFGLQLMTILLALQRPDPLHVSMMLFPLISLTPMMAEALALAKIETDRFIFILLPLIVYSLFVPSLFNVLCYTPPFFFFDKSPKLEYIKENCRNSNYIYAGPFLPGLYFATGKLQPTPFSFLITNHQTEEQFLQAKNNLERKKPLCAILDYEIVQKFKYNKNNSIDQYINNHYHLIKIMGYTLIYKINP
jgi:hypothetical protein